VKVARIGRTCAARWYLLLSQPLVEIARMNCVGIC
jgi:hypothetical protein